MTEAGLKRLAEDEGFRGQPYQCTAGKTTIGYGFNLDDWPLSEAECLPILKARADRVKLDLARSIPGFSRLPEDAQDVLINMAYQMGVGGLLKFKRFLAALETGNYEDAYHEMTRSQWYQQTPNRAKRLADSIRRMG